MANGISGFGTTIDSGVTGAIAEVRSISLPGMEADEIDVTTMLSANGVKEFVAGLIDAGEVTLNILYESTQANTIFNNVAQAPEVWTFTFPDTATYIQTGFIKTAGIEIPHDDAISQTITIRMVGAPNFTP